MSSPARTCSGDTASPRSAATSATSGPPAEEAEELDLRVGSRRRVDLPAEAPRLSKRLVVRPQALEHDPGDLRAETLVTARSAGEVPGVHGEIRQAWEQRHLDGHLAADACDRPFHDAGLAQSCERGVAHRLPRRSGVDA